MTEKELRQEGRFEELSHLVNGVTYDKRYAMDGIGLRKSLKNLIVLYRGICGKDDNLNDILDLGAEYAEMRVDRNYSYETELEYVQNIMRALAAYEDILVAQAGSLEKKINDFHEETAGSVLSFEQKRIEKKYVGMQDLIRNRRIAITVIQMDFLNLLPGFLEVPGVVREYKNDSSVTDKPVFLHCPHMYDITPEVFSIHSAFAGLGNVARLYVDYILGMIRDTGDGSVCVRLWKKENGEFSPVYISLDKAAEYEKWMVERNLGFFWVGLVLDAFESAGIEPSKSAAGFTEQCLGPVALCLDKSSSLAEAAGSEEKADALFKDMVDWIICGYPVYAYTAEDPGKPYIVLGVYYRDKTPVIRVRDPEYVYSLDIAEDLGIFDYELEDFVSRFSGLEFNSSEEMKNFRHVRTIGYDIIDQYDISDYLENTITDEMAKRYQRCAFELYASLLSTSSSYDDNSPEYESFLEEVKQLLAIISTFVNVEDETILPVFNRLHDIIGQYRSFLANEPANVRMRRLVICDCADELLNLFSEGGFYRKDPRQYFEKCFADKIAGELVKRKKKGFNESMLDFMASCMLEEKPFRNIVSKLNIVQLFNPGPKLVSDAAEEYCKNS